MPLDRAGYWERYWAALGRLEPGARGPQDRYVDRILACADGGRWLDAGCGRHSVPPWRREALEAVRGRGVTLFGCDLDLAALPERGDGAPVCGATLERLPFADASFDLVTSNMVFEHLERPEPSVRELVRVTRAGGRILVHTVNARHYLALAARLTPHRFHRWVVGVLEGRRPEDVYPTRYRANDERRLRALFEAHGARAAAGGAIADIPLCVPFPGLFWLALAFGLIERRLARLPGLRSLLCGNLLMEFRRL